MENDIIWPCLNDRKPDTSLYDSYVLSLMQDLSIPKELLQMKPIYLEIERDSYEEYQQTLWYYNARDSTDWHLDTQYAKKYESGNNWKFYAINGVVDWDGKKCSLLGFDEDNFEEWQSHLEQIEQWQPSWGVFVDELKTVLTYAEWIKYIAGLNYTLKCFKAPNGYSLIYKDHINWLYKKGALTSLKKMKEK